MLNKDKTFSVDLSIFDGQVLDMAPGNLPAGSSPACTDMFFGGQYTATRPALIHAIPESLVDGGDVLSHNDYPLPTGQTQTVLLYDDGSLWTRNVQTGTATQVGTTSTQGARFKSTAAFDKFFMAFRPPVGGDLPNLSGCDIPLYINLSGHLRPVSQDAPGGGFSVVGVTIAPEDLVTPGVWLTGPNITSIVFGGEKTVTVNIPNKGTVTLTEYTNATVTLDSAVTLAKGQIVQLYGITWASPNGPQWANGNCLANHAMINMGFDGNYDGNTTLGTNAQPEGWDNTTPYNSITPDGDGFLNVSANGLGLAYTLKGTSGTLNFVAYSPSVGVLANVTFPMANFTNTTAWYQGNFSSAMPASIPPDAVFYLYVSGGSANSMISQSFYQDYYGTPIGQPNKSYIMRFQAVVSGSNTQIDNLEIIDAQQPVLNNSLRVSYPDNEFGYDNQNGFTIGLDTTDFIAGCFLQRQYLYAVTDGIGQQHTILANNQLPNEWDVSIHASECACAGPDAVTTARSTSWWMGRHGVQQFHGDAPKKISQANSQDFEQTNWDAASNSVMAADTVQKVLYMSFPTGDAEQPNLAYSLNTRLADSEFNVPDPVHVSSYTGRIISTDLSEKWCPMSLPINSMCMSTQETPNGFAKVMTFGGGKAGPVAADVSTSAADSSGDISISLTPENDDDFVLVCTSAFRTTSTPSGWTRSSGGYYTIQADSTDLLTFDASSPSPSEWSAVMASFAVSGGPTLESNTNIDFGTGPESQYTHTITANAGDAIVLQFTGFSQFAPTFSISDNQGNLYTVYQNTQTFGGLQNTAYLAVALGCKAGSTTITFSISNFGTPTGSTGFQIELLTYSGLAAPVGFGQVYLQDYWNYPPVTPKATVWNCIDADYGVIPWDYQTYFFVSHDVEKQAMDALYRKLFGYMSVHASGVGLLQIQPFVSSLANPWPALAPFPLTLVDPGSDYNLGLNVLGERMSLKFSGVPAGEGQGTAMLLTHLIVSLREDNVFPVSGMW